MAALLAIACLLVAGQALVQHALQAQEGDAHLINIAGRQRMLSQRLCMLLLASPELAHPDELQHVADEWETNQTMLVRGRVETDGNSPTVSALFAQIADPHAVMLDAARTAIATGNRAAAARIATAQQQRFLDGMNEIVATYEREAHARVVRLRYYELVLLAISLAVLVLEGAFVFRPAVRALQLYLAERDLAERQLVQVTDREQKRLAQDLHDGLSQHLVGVTSLLGALRQDPRAAAVHPPLDEVRALLAEAIDESRSLARGLYSHTLEVEGLTAALRELALHTERIYGVSCHVAAAHEVRAPRATSVQLYSIAREAVANAAKHARATTIEIELVAQARQLVLEVRDDGIGIGTPRGGMGLRLMAQRARAVGASFEIRDGDARGTVVTCIVPEVAT
ncbi:MAG: type IV pili methyl-accepting chemotaxis transducer N-terminal domain-containing protein [Kofleriaceae bacterium]|nr:type IV pili methyl-accepting chemotaxis transducer N-terminal domain-containing protein [Kofleriaceae bacterium]